MADQRTGRRVITVGLALLGAWGFAGSTTHVLHLAEANGQTGWLAWNVAGTVELLAVLAGWEIQLRSRAGERAVFPKVLLAGTVLFVVAANLAMAKPTVWGYVVAVVPPLCFFGAAGLIETRPAAPAVPVPVADSKPEARELEGAPLIPSPVPVSTPAPAPQGDGPDLEAAAREAARRIRAAGGKPSGVKLARVLRADMGVSVRNDRIPSLVALVTDDDPDEDEGERVPLHAVTGS